MVKKGNIVEFMEATPAFKCIASVQFDDSWFSPMLPVKYTNLILFRLCFCYIASGFALQLTSMLMPSYLVLTVMTLLLVNYNSFY